MLYSAELFCLNLCWPQRRQVLHNCTSLSSSSFNYLQKMCMCVLTHENSISHALSKIAHWPIVLPRMILFSHSSVCLSVCLSVCDEVYGAANVYKCIGYAALAIRYYNFPPPTPTNDYIPSNFLPLNLEVLLIYYILLSLSRDHFVNVATITREYCYRSDH